MKVLTVSYDDISEYTSRIIQKMKADNFHPDAVIGIRTGGVYIADLFARQLGFNDGKALQISVSRQSSKNKKKLFRSLIKLLPVKMLDFLRVFEAKMLFKREARNRISDISLPEELESSCYYKILIVDDAVDSGATLSAVLGMIQSRYPDLEIKTSAMTVTTDNPAVSPDYYLYKNSTLIRFPWSLDSK